MTSSPTPAPSSTMIIGSIAVERFLENKIKFLDIPEIIKEILKVHQPIFNPSLKELLAVKDWAKNQLI